MITQIKRSGNSLVVRLPTEFLKYMNLREGDWIDISDINKVEKFDKETTNKEKEISQEEQINPEQIIEEQNYESINETN